MDRSQRDALVGELHELAGGWGTPAAVQYCVDHLVGSSTGAVAYDFSVRLGLLLGDLAAVVESTPETSSATDATTGAEQIDR